MAGMMTLTSADNRSEAYGLGLSHKIMRKKDKNAFGSAYCYGTLRDPEPLPAPTAYWSLLHVLFAR